MSKTKSNPLRMCIGCNQMKEKKELIRIVKNKDKTGKINIFLDFTKKSPGRGSYLCDDNLECLNKAKKSKRLSKIFSSQIDQTIFDDIEYFIKNNS